MRILRIELSDDADGGDDIARELHYTCLMLAKTWCLFITMTFENCPVVLARSRSVTRLYDILETATRTKRHTNIQRHTHGERERD